MARIAARLSEVEKRALLLYGLEQEAKRREGKRSGAGLKKNRLVASVRTMAGRPGHLLLSSTPKA